MFYFSDIQYDINFKVITLSIFEGKKVYQKTQKKTTMINTIKNLI